MSPWQARLFSLWWPGLLLIAANLAVAWISPRFEYGGDPLTRPIALFVGIQMLAGVLYLFSVAGLRRTPGGKSPLVWAIAVGFVLRASFFNSTPILEDDYYRYLWDGAVTASGENPYAYAPSLFDESSEDFGGDTDSKLYELAGQSGVVVSRINHPGLRTIYPPVAQGAFALAYWISPWSLFAWRMVLLLFDTAALCILAAILRTLGISSLWLVVYWWNPLLIKETFNSGHMDVVALPFVLGAVLLSVRSRKAAGMLSLALAAGAKLWPVVLAPVFLRPLVARPRRLITALCVFAVLLAAMFIPVYAGGLGADSGFTAYGRRWEMNDALYMLIHWVCKYVLKTVVSSPGIAHLAARGVVMLILAVLIAFALRKGTGEAPDFCGKCLFVVTAVFLLSPTQFPWYFIWILPFLAIRPRASLLTLTVFLPLYYLRFHFYAREHVKVFDYGIVWLEFVPVWLLLIWEWQRDRRGESVPRPEVSA